MNDDKSVKTIATKDLQFDRNNPRLAEYGISANATDEEVIATLWDAMDVMELVQSIAASGFFPHEQLIVAKEGQKNIVIEGNRRLAAVRVLLDPEIANKNEWTLPGIARERRESLKMLPVFMQSRENAWRYLGFKHVNGPAKWSSYAKAKYIADVHSKYSVSLAQIAQQIGDGHRTVQRLFRGLMVLEQAERKKVWDRDDRSRPRLSFSHLYTGLDYDGISTFISLKSLDEETKSPVPENRLKELGELCVWLYGSKKAGTSPAVATQNPHLRQLDAILQNREAIAALRDTNDVSISYEYSRPASAVLEEALLSAKRSLQKVRGFLTTGFDESEDMLKVAGSVADLADDIYREMERKISGESRNRSRR